MLTAEPHAAPAPLKARLGVWTPWAFVLCVECDYIGLKDSQRANEPRYAAHLKVLASTDRTAEFVRPAGGDLLATCDTCQCRCWVRSDVALLQQVGLKSSELDWEGPFGWGMEQTGGMCAALVFSTEGREIVVTAMDGDLFVGEYAESENDDDRWTDAIRTWQSASIYEGDEMKAQQTLDVLVAECARKAIEFVRNPVNGASK